MSYAMSYEVCHFAPEKGPGRNANGGKGNVF